MSIDASVGIHEMGLSKQETKIAEPALVQEFRQETNLLGIKDRLAFGDIPEFNVIASDLQRLIEAENKEEEAGKIVAEYQDGQRSVDLNGQRLVLKVLDDQQRDTSKHGDYYATTGRYTKLEPNLGEALMWTPGGSNLNTLLGLHHMHKSLMLDARGRRDGKENEGFAAMINLTDVMFMEKLSRIDKLPAGWKIPIWENCNPNVSGKFNYGGRVKDEYLPGSENVVRQYWQRIEPRVLPLKNRGFKIFRPLIHRPIDLSPLQIKK